MSTLLIPTLANVAFFAMSIVIVILLFAAIIVLMGCKGDKNSILIYNKEFTQNDTKEFIKIFKLPKTINRVQTEDILSSYTDFLKEKAKERACCGFCDCENSKNNQ